MTLRPVLLFFALLSLVGAAFLWFRTPPDESSVFSETAATAELSGTVATYRAPKSGEERIRLVTTNGAAFFTDCLAIPAVCSGSRESPHALSITAYFLTPSVFWPLSVSEQGRTIVNREGSLLAYRLYTEKEGTLYRLPLALAIFFAVGAFWFGNRPAFDQARR